MGKPTTPIDIEAVPLIPLQSKHPLPNEFASSSSSTEAVLDHIDPSTEAPPAYENVEAEIPTSREAPTVMGAERNILMIPGDMTGDKTTLTTLYSMYSKDAEFLESMIQEQSTFPPTLKVQIRGSHTSRVGGSPSTITDFNFDIDMTDILPSKSKICVAEESRYPPFRNGPDPERLNNDVGFWCEKYTSDEAIVKRFRFKRKVVNLDEGKFKELITNLIRSSHYGGKIDIQFPQTNDHIVVFSPCVINTCRASPFTCLLFYITCLWIFAMIYLQSVTSNYEVKAEYEAPAQCENQLLEYWKENIKRAVLGRNKDHISLDHEFRRRTAEILATTSNLQPGPETDRIRYGVWGSDEA